MPRIPDYYRCGFCIHYWNGRCGRNGATVPEWFGCKEFELDIVEDDGK